MTTDAQNWPFFEEDEIEAAARVLRSGKVNRWTGEENRKFEEEFCAYVGAGHAVALANGTVALEAALRCAGIGPGDDVVVTSRSFVASAGAAPLVGARPVFADVDAESQNMTAESIRAALTAKTRAVIVVHLGGWICDMAPIMDLAGEHDLLVVEDCAQALGASRNGKTAGSWGDAATWSFCQDKVLTTGGEGGMLTTNDSDLWRRAWSFKDHGKNIDAVGDAGPTPAFKWVHAAIGTNLRMTEMQAAIGRIALPKVEARIRRRNEIAAMLDETFRSDEALRITIPPPEVRHAYYKYYCFVRPDLLAEGWNRDRILEELHAEDVPAFSGICAEIYREEAFVSAGYGPNSPHPVARSLGETSIMLPIHHNLSDETVRRWSNAIRRVVRHAGLRRAQP